MINATKRIAGLMAEENEPLLEVCINLVTKYGTADDAAYLLPLFLQTKNVQLLKPLQACGNKFTADQLYQQAIENEQLKAGFPPETLLALGYLQHPETEKVLLAYYKTIFDQKLDWQMHEAVCLALLNYPCKGYEALIRQEIEKCLHQWLFAEMIPVLACKTGDVSLAEKLFHHGCTKASSDSNAGLLLGIALFGTGKKDLFKKAIYNHDWEAGATATGNRKYTMMGLSFLQISMAEMFADIRALAQENNAPLPQHLFLLESMQEAKLEKRGQYLVRCIPPHAESFTAVYGALFAPADGITIYTLIEQVGVMVWKELLLQSFNRLQELYALHMAHEAELHYLQKEKDSNPF